MKPIVNFLVEGLLGKQNGWIIDCTLGGGGHTQKLFEAIKVNPLLRSHRILGIDQDLSAIERAKSKFQEEIDLQHLVLMHTRISQLPSWMRGKQVLGLIADLGVSSDQLMLAERGLSFHLDGPLDMRLDPTRGETCFELISRVSESELEKILWEFGDERFAKRISRAIIDKKSRGSLPRTTRELSEIIIKAIPHYARHKRIHAATKTFQALRIVVNEEMKELDSLFQFVLPLMQKGGRAAILSFHSLEDRRVKMGFRAPGFYAFTKKPIVPDEGEIKENPRARSAKLRMAEMRFDDK